MGGYIFDKKDAEEFCRAQGIRYRIRGEEMILQKCPYCGAVSKDEDTCSINLSTGQYHCFRASCGAKGNMLTLARDFDFHIDRIDQWQPVPVNRFRTYAKKAEYNPNDTMKDFLRSRGISETTAERYKLTVRKDDPNILVFPFTTNDEIVFVKYRDMNFQKDKVRPNGKKASKEWCEADSKPILFGIDQCVEECKTLVITEGQMDSLALAEAGIQNPVSVPNGALGMTWIPHCWEFMEQFENIIVFGDHEKGHISLLDELARRMPNKIKHIREDDYKDCKDANDILLKYGKDYLQKIVARAIPIPNNRIIRMADVQRIDPFSIPKLKTGFKTLDGLLKGGLPFGQMTLISGKSGEGKSTLASQLICEAVDQGYTSFIYSGEMGNSQVQSWINFQFAGKRIMEYQTSSTSDTYYKVSDTNVKLMTEWYRDKLYIMSDNYVDNDEKITQTVMDAICKNGAQVILVDNLMTAIDLEDDASDVHERQTNIAKRLAGIAKEYDVLVILVAHQRKQKGDQNDVVAGSSNIVNLASVHLSYEQGNEVEQSYNQRRLKLNKNRLFGYRKLEGILCSYDDKSKRVYQSMDEEQRFKDYGWISSLPEDEFMDPGQIDLPFH